MNQISKMLQKFTVTTLSVCFLAVMAPLAQAADLDSPDRAKAMKAWEAFLNNQNAANGDDVYSSGAVSTEVTTHQSDLTDRTSSSGSQILKGDLSSGWSSMLAVMFGGFGLMAALGLRNKTPEIANWLATRAPNQRPHTPSPKKASTSALSMDDQVSIVAVKPLGSKNKLAIVKVFDKKLVLGLSGDQVTLMKDFDSIEESPDQPMEEPDNAFGQLVEDFFNDSDLPENKGKQAVAQKVMVEAVESPPKKTEAAPPSSTAVNAALQDALRRKQVDETSAARRALTHGKRLERAETPPKPLVNRAMASKRPQTATGSVPRWNNTVSGSPAQRYAANSLKTPPASGGSATDQVLRKIQTMRRFR